MKRLIFLSIFMLSGMFGKEHFNPNGYPGTLNIGYTYDVNLYSKYPSDVPYSLIDINMPINTWMTMKFNFKPDFIDYSDSDESIIESTINHKLHLSSNTLANYNVICPLSSII